jgi:hypothetical protein
MKRATLLLATLGLLIASRASARCEGDPGCAKLDTLLAAPGASSTTATGTSDVLAPWEGGFGFQLSYARNPIAVLVPTTGPTGSRLELVDRQVTASWLFALGLGAGLELGVALDSVVDAGGPGLAGANAGRALRETALGDVRTQLRWAAVERARKPSEGTVGEGFGLALTAALTAPTGMSGAFASERGAMLQPTVTGDLVRGPLRAAVDLGARLRGDHALFDATWGSQLLAAASASYDVLAQPRLLAVGAEAWSLTAIGDGRATIDALGTVSSAPAWAGELMLVAGAGRSFVAAGPDLAAPDLRMVFAVRYAPLAVDRDGDGLVDKNDPCPSEAGPVRDTETPGCPDRAPEDLTKASSASSAAPAVSEPPPAAPPAPASPPEETAPSAPVEPAAPAPPAAPTPEGASPPSTTPSAP